MSLQRWLSERRLREHRSSPAEITALWHIVQRDLRDAALEQLSADRRYSTAYNAILQLATIVLRASGYRTAGEAHHWMTFQALPHLMDSLESARRDYFDACRRKRNVADYDPSGNLYVTDCDANAIYGIRLSDMIYKTLVGSGLGYSNGIILPVGHDNTGKTVP